MPFSTVRVEGALIPGDILDQIAKGEAVGQRPQDFGLEKNRRLTDEVSTAWQDAVTYWKALSRSLSRLDAEDPVTTQTREQWVLPLLQSLGYEKVPFVAKAAEVGGQSFALSHRAGEHEDSPPIHIVGLRADLNARPPSGRPRLSPHALVQEYLNRTEHLWGIVTNGRLLRLLRDSSRMSRPSYVEFDLEQMMNAEAFSDFYLLYRLLHRTRLPSTDADAPKCLLETYHQQGIEQGSRVREKLRDGVEKVLRLVGQGLLEHPANSRLVEELRSGRLTPEEYYRQLLRDGVEVVLKLVGQGLLEHPANSRLVGELRSGRLTPEEYYRQLLRMVYRLLFLMVTEERDLIEVSGSNNAYERFYSVTRLREVCAKPYAVTWRHDDLWQGLLTTFALFADESTGTKLGLSPLNGSLFGPNAMPALEDSRLVNGVMLEALRNLSLFQDQKVTRRVNYAALDVEELGSVYESLLDYHPIVRDANGRLQFELAFGTERKTTGSYYTRPELVAELIKSALVPVIEAKLSSAKSTEDKAKALLSIKICDPACGSGHFLLAAARRIGRELARLRTGEDEPTPEQFRLAVREVIQHCIYGVDLNPLAVDLCKLALWLEGHSTGKPLSFLDHRIKCGNSLVGVFSLDVFKEGIPDDAYKPVIGDDKTVASAIRKQNRQERAAGRLLSLDFGQRVDPSADLPLFAEAASRLEAIADDSPAEVKRKSDVYEQARKNETWWRDKTACDVWTAAFFSPLTRADDPAIPTSDRLWRYIERPKTAHGLLLGRAGELSASNRFFHWPLEFPDVFAQGGFDCVLGNPPWERIKLQEQEFFATRDTAIARAPNKAARQRLIDDLRRTNPALADEFERAKHEHEAQSKFVRAGGRFPLTAVGDVNTYALFAELVRVLLGPTGRAGIIVPTGIATDASTSRFFGDLNAGRALVSLYDFENRKAIFPAVDSRQKFCLLSISREKTASADFAFFLLGTEDMLDRRRRYTLSPDDLALFNPNTRTCPTFRTKVDAELTRVIYQRVPVLVNEQTGANPWGVRFMAMFHMSNDSGLFRTRAELEAQGFRLQGNIFVKGNERYLPLYEAKMIWHYDHRFGSYERAGSRDSTSLPATRPDQYADPGYVPLPCYWEHESEVSARLAGQDSKWLLGFRDVTNATNERTAIFAAIPRTAVGHTMPLMLWAGRVAKCVCGLAGNLDSVVFDWVTRQKLAATHMTYFILEQLPVLPPDRYSQPDLDFIVPRVLELTYTAWDMKPFAEDMGYDGPPFKWDEDRRALLRAELDAYYAKLYGLTRKQLRYILDPRSLTDHELENILDPAEDPPDAPRTKDFPGETFRVLKEKEIKKYGEYRTQRLVLEAWDRLSAGSP